MLKEELYGDGTLQWHHKIDSDSGDGDESDYHRVVHGSCDLALCESTVAKAIADAASVEGRQAPELIRLSNMRLTSSGVSQNAAALRVVLRQARQVDLSQNAGLLLPSLSGMPCIYGSIFASLANVYSHAIRTRVRKIIRDQATPAEVAVIEVAAKDEIIREKLSQVDDEIQRLEDRRSYTSSFMHYMPFSYGQ